MRNAEQNEDGKWSIGNAIFSVIMDCPSDPREALPLFGAKYRFKLHEVVDLDEYLVHFPLLMRWGRYWMKKTSVHVHNTCTSQFIYFCRMLSKLDMELVLKQNFYDFYQEHGHIPYNAQLIHRMKAFNRKVCMHVCHQVHVLH